MRATSAAATIDTDLARLVRDFVEKEVFPLAARTDREHRFPAEAISKAAQLGLLGITVPEQYGGAGMDRGAMTVLIEGVARVCASTAVVLDVHTVAIEPLLTFGPATHHDRSIGVTRPWKPGIGDRGRIVFSAGHDRRPTCSGSKPSLPTARLRARSRRCARLTWRTTRLIRLGN